MPASRLRLLCLMIVTSWLVVGCNGAKKIDVGGACVLNSDCNQGLVCTWGKCHDPCHTSVDCPAGQSCITASDQSTVCQLPVETHCAYNSDCQPSLVCAADLKCRNQCQGNVDCSSGQTCTTTKTCAEPSQVDSNNNLFAPDGGVSGCPVGAETCSCYPNDTCNAGLTCASHLCVSLGASGSGGTSGNGGTAGSGGTSAGGGTTSSKGGTSNAGGIIGAGGTVSSATGGSVSTSATGGATSTCAGAIPTQSGSLSVSPGYYVTAGSLHGYGFTWKGGNSNAATCITPACDSTGCTRAFGTSSLCAAGIVAADTTYNSVVGLGMLLNQTPAGETSPGTVTIANSVTVTTYAGSGTGNAYMRVQITDNANNDYCVDSGSWSSGTAIPISRFNMACWNNTGTYASSTTPIQKVHLTIPSTSSTDRPFDICMLNVTIQ